MNMSLGKCPNKLPHGPPVHPHNLLHLVGADGGEDKDERDHVETLGGEGGGPVLLSHVGHPGETPASGIVLQQTE